MFRFDHLVIAVRDLGSAIACYHDLGFDVRLGGRHTGRGTENAIIRFGLDYLELIAVYDETEAARAGRGSLVKFLRQHEGGLVSYALATDHIDALAAQLKEVGLDALGPFPMERQRPNGTRLSWRLLIPNGEAYRRPWPFFIQWDQKDSLRLEVEPAGDHENHAFAVQQVHLLVSDLGAAEDLYRSLGFEHASPSSVPNLGADSAMLAIGDFSLVLLAPSGEGLAAKALAASGEGPFQVVLQVDDLDAIQRSLHDRGIALQPAPGAPGGLLIDSPRVLGTRLVLRGA